MTTYTNEIEKIQKHAELVEALDTSLTEYVYDQLGCDNFDEFVETLSDVNRGGADAGWSGFIYYKDTCEFYEDNQSEIVKLVEEMAESLGESAIKLVQGFRCLGSDYTEKEIAKTLYTEEHDETIANALAWFALEEIARLTDI